jgi:pyruvate-ferredoxin/flavodoxin oxidoreductase
MLDIGFQNLSRLLASGKPVRTIVLDTQVYSNTGGQACTAGFTGQVSDMAGYGAAQQGKEEIRKELSLLAIAHRTSFVLQSSQASQSHLLSGVLRGLASRRPAVFNIYTPCPPEHGLSDEGSACAARLALESRAFPVLVYDPDAGPSLAERLDLQGNPAMEDSWPTYQLSYRDDGGGAKTMELPMTIGDWAATEARFAKHFSKVERSSSDEAMLPFHEYLELSKEERSSKVPFVYTLDSEKHLDRLKASPEIVELAEERLGLWSDLREMAGVGVSQRVLADVTADLERKYGEREAALRAEYEAKLSEQGAEQAHVVVNRIVTGLFGEAADSGALPASPPRIESSGSQAVLQETLPVAVMPEGAGGTLGEEEVTAFAREPYVVTAFAREPYVDSVLCTTCNECTNLNSRMFVYNENKQAVLEDPRAGTFQELVRAAELCASRLIHPGDPLDPSERNLDEWLERAKPFN